MRAMMTRSIEDIAETKRFGLAAGEPTDASTKSIEAALAEAA
jgi:hypothetical protein